MAKPKRTKERRASLHERLAVTRVRATEERIARLGEEEAEALRRESLREKDTVAKAQRARPKQQEAGRARRGQGKVDWEEVRKRFVEWRNSGKYKHRSEACRRLADEFKKQARNGKLSPESVRIHTHDIAWR